MGAVSKELRMSGIASCVFFCYTTSVTRGNDATNILVFPEPRNPVMMVIGIITSTAWA